MNSTSKTAIIAGGTGLIGSHLATQLENRGYRVILLTRNPNKSNHHPNIEKKAGMAKVGAVWLRCSKKVM